MATTKTVDFVPEYNEQGDFKKVSEYNFYNLNAKLIPVIILVSMEKGSNQLFPDMGARDIFMSIPFTDESHIDGKLAEIKNGIQPYVKTKINVTLDDSSNLDEGIVNVVIEVEGVPGALTVDTNKSGIFRIHHPSVYKK